MKSHFCLIPLLITIFLLNAVFLSCSGPSKEAVKEAKASELYDRVCSVIRTSNGYTTEWENIKNKIIEDKDTIFLSVCSDFQIIVRKTVSINQLLDTTQKTKDSAPPAEPTPDSSKKDSNNSWR